MVSQGRDLNPAPTSEPLIIRKCLPSSAPVYLHYLSISLSPPPHPTSQGFQVVCEAAQSDSSSPTAGEQSCRRGNSVEKGGPSQQPPPVKGPSKKK